MRHSLSLLPMPQLFRLWDHDNSGYLDHDEVLTVLRYERTDGCSSTGRILRALIDYSSHAALSLAPCHSWFLKHIPEEDNEKVLSTIWDQADTDTKDKDKENTATPATEADGTADVEAGSPPAAYRKPAIHGEMVGEMVKRIEGGELKEMIKAAEKIRVAGVLDELDGTPDDDEVRLTLPLFKAWLLRISSNLEGSTFKKAMNKLCDVAKRYVCAKQIFEVWDIDRSGILDFSELRALFKWLKENATVGLDYTTLWDELPDTGTADGPTFDLWLLTVTKDMAAVSFDELQEKIKARLKELKEPTAAASPAPESANEKSLTQVV